MAATRSRWQPGGLASMTTLRAKPACRSESASPCTEASFRPRMLSRAGARVCACLRRAVFACKQRRAVGELAEQAAEGPDVYFRCVLVIVEVELRCPVVPADTSCNASATVTADELRCSAAQHGGSRHALWHGVVCTYRVLKFNVDMYVVMAWPGWRILALLKSANLSAWVWMSIRMFSGFKSRCITPFASRYIRARPNCRAISESLPELQASCAMRCSARVK